MERGSPGQSLGSWTEPGNSTGHSLILAPSLSQTRLSLTHWNGSALGKGERFLLHVTSRILGKHPQYHAPTENSLGRSSSFSKDLDAQLHRMIAERIVTYISTQNFLPGRPCLLCVHLPAWRFPELLCVQPELIIMA